MRVVYIFAETSDKNGKLLRMSYTKLESNEWILDTVKTERQRQCCTKSRNKRKLLRIHTRVDENISVRKWKQINWQTTMAMGR